MSGFNWSDEAVADFRRLYSERLSFSQLAAEMMRLFGGYLTRNATIGKAHRLGLDRRGHNWSARTQRPRLKVDPVVAPKSKVRVLRKASQFSKHETLVELVETEITDIAPEDIPASQRRSLLNLTNETCRWPCGDPGTPGFFFCGGPADLDDGKPYCPAHMRRAHQARTHAPRPWYERSRRRAA